MKFYESIIEGMKGLFINRRNCIVIPEDGLEGQIEPLLFPELFGRAVHEIYNYKAQSVYSRKFVSCEGVDSDGLRRFKS